MASKLVKKIFRRSYNGFGHAALSVLNLPPVNRSLERRFEQALSEHMPPDIDPVDQHIVDGIARDGFFKTTLAALALPGQDEMFAEASGILATYRQRASRNEFAEGEIRLATAAEMLAHPNIFRWGLQTRLLRIAEAYLGQAAAYDGYNIFYSAKQKDGDRQTWHRDREDRRVLKMCIYCRDVDEAGGALQVIPKKLFSQEMASVYRYPSLTTEEIGKNLVVPGKAEEAMVTFTGPAGTVIFCETGLQYHRGKPPESVDREAIYFHYFSNRPRHPFYCDRSGLTRQQVASLVEGMPDAQREAALWMENLPRIARIVPNNMI